MRIARVLSAVALAAAASVAMAGPQALGTGPGTYTFSDNHDLGWFVELGPGTVCLMPHAIIYSNDGMTLARQPMGLAGLAKSLRSDRTIGDQEGVRSHRGVLLFSHLFRAVVLRNVAFATDAACGRALMASEQSGKGWDCQA